MWEEILKNGEILPRIGDIWDCEQRLPGWFRAASKIWTATEDDFRDFVVEKCQEVWGLKDDTGNFCAYVYVEKQPFPNTMIIHLSIVRKIDPEIFIEQSGWLRNIFLRRGVKIIRGWILQKNGALLKILSSIGFMRSGFTMRWGEWRGQLLRWEMVEVRAG